MNPDPYDVWYVRHLPPEGHVGSQPERWALFTISHDAESFDCIHYKAVDSQGLDQWLNLLVSFLNELSWELSEGSQQSANKPGIDILLALHKNCSVKDIPNPCSPFPPMRLQQIFERMRLNPQHFHIRGAGAHTGLHTCHTYKDANGYITGISHVVRTGFPSSKVCGSIWAFALTWNARTGRSTAFIEGFSHEHGKELLPLLNGNSQNLDHPLVLPEILLHMLTVQLNEGSRVVLEEEYYKLEGLTGLTSFPSATNMEWYLGFEEFKAITGTANKTLTRMVFLTRRFRLLTKFAERLHSLLDELKNEEFENELTIPLLKKSHHQWSQRILNRIGILEAYEHQTECMQKRIGNLNNRLETVLSQMNNQKQSQIATINLSIAQAVRSDSIPMRTIAYVTLVLLPGAVVSSIFGMNFFQYDSATRTVLVAKTFWQYWAITVPATLLVIGTWNIWNYREKRKGSQGAK